MRGIQPLWVAQRCVAASRRQGKGDQQGNGGAPAAGRGFGWRGFLSRGGFFQQAALKLAPGLFEIVLAQRAVVAITLEFA